MFHNSNLIGIIVTSEGIWHVLYLFFFYFLFLTYIICTYLNLRESRGRYSKYQLTILDHPFNFSVKLARSLLLGHQHLLWLTLSFSTFWCYSYWNYTRVLQLQACDEWLSLWKPNNSVKHLLIWASSNIFSAWDRFIRAIKVMSFVLTKSKHDEQSVE